MNRLILIVLFVVSLVSGFAEETTWLLDRIDRIHLRHWHEGEPSPFSRLQQFALQTDISREELIAALMATAQRHRGKESSLSVSCVATALDSLSKLKAIEAGFLMRELAVDDDRRLRQAAILAYVRMDPADLREFADLVLVRTGEDTVRDRRTLYQNIGELIHRAKTRQEPRTLGGRSQTGVQYVDVLERCLKKETYKYNRRMLEGMIAINRSKANGSYEK